MAPAEALAIEMKRLFSSIFPQGPPPPGAADRRELRRMPPALPPAIARRLHALRIRVLSLSWIEGILWSLMALCALALTQGVLDWIFDLPVRVRAAFLLFDAGVFGFLIVRFGARPWHQRLTPEAAALRAERSLPDLRTGLISSVQLARRSDGSPAIVAALLEKMTVRVARLDFRAAAPAGHLPRLAAGAVFLILVAGALTTWFAPKSLILLRRMVLLSDPLPTETIVVAVSRDIAVPVGQTIELSARALGAIPRSGRVEVTYEGRRPEIVSVSPKAASPDEFSLTLPNVQQPLTYRFLLNDGRGEEWKVTLLHPPVLESIRFEAIPPPYTGLPSTRHAPGNLSLLAGSKLRITGTSSLPLQAARLQLHGLHTELPLKPEGNERTGFQAEIDIPREKLSGLSVDLTNDKGIPSHDNTIFKIEILRDRPPEIILAEDQPEKQNLIVNQTPQLRFEVRDDFKVQKVFLCVQSLNTLGEGEEPNPEKAKQIPLEVPQPAAALAFNHRWTDVRKQIDWAEGLSYITWIKAVDNNTVTGPGVTYSAPQHWAVVSVETRRGELAEQLKRQAESIKDLSGTQEEIRKKLGELLKLEKK